MNSGWWHEEVYEALTKHNITFCSINHPKLPVTLIMNTAIAYVRLHGNPEMFYSEYSLADLKELHKDLQKNKALHEVFVYFNNTASTAGVMNAQTFMQLKIL